MASNDYIIDYVIRLFESSSTKEYQHTDMDSNLSIDNLSIDNLSIDKLSTDRFGGYDGWMPAYSILHIRSSREKW